MKETENYFDGLTAEQITNERIGKWGDYELLDAWHNIRKQADRQRETAVLELILRSPEHSELVDYKELYFDLTQAYRLDKQYIKAIGWLYAAMAYEEQHEPTINTRISWRSDLAEAYLNVGEFNAGLTLLSQALQLQPGNLQTYHTPIHALFGIGWYDLLEELLARALAVAAEVGDEEYNAQWKELLAQIKDADDQEANSLSGVDADVISSFHAALALPISDDFDDDISQPFLPPLDQLTTADSLLPAHTNEILAQSKVLIPELIRLAFSDPDTPGPAHAIALLRQIRDEETAVFTELSSWLDKADGNWQENLSPSIGKIGGFTTAELKTIAADTTYHTFIRTGATEALRKRLDQNPELQEEVIDLFRRLLNRPEAHELAAEEEFIGFLISDALDADLRELYPDIKRAFVEDRVDPSIVDLRSVEEEWELPFTEPLTKRRYPDDMNLQLECTVCGRKRFHFTRHVLVDTITLGKQREGEPVEFDAHILDHEIICPKCGSVDQYRLTPQAHMSLLGQQSPETLLAMFSGKKPDKVEPNPRVHYKGAHALGGPMHPLKAIQRYQQLITAQPDNANLYVRLGGIFLFVMRFEQALTYLRRGYELDPEDIEATMRLAMAEHDFGDRQQAKELYERVFQLARQHMFSPEKMEIAAIARDGLKALQRGSYSPMDIPVSASVYYGDPEKQKSSRAGRSNKKKKLKKRRR